MKEEMNNVHISYNGYIVISVESWASVCLLRSQDYPSYRGIQFCDVEVPKKPHQSSANKMTNFPTLISVRLLFKYRRLEPLSSLSACFRPLVQQVPWYIASDSMPMEVAFWYILLIIRSFCFTIIQNIDVYVL